MEQEHKALLDARKYARRSEMEDDKLRTAVSGDMYRSTEAGFAQYTEVMNRSLVKSGPFYQNPNNFNDLSVMNISHISEGKPSLLGGSQQVAQNSPGMQIIGQDACAVFAHITNEDHMGLQQFLRF